MLSVNVLINCYTGNTAATILQQYYSTAKYHITNSNYMFTNIITFIYIYIYKLLTT